MLSPEHPGLVDSLVHSRWRTMFAPAPCCASVSPRGEAQGDDGAADPIVDSNSGMSRNETKTGPGALFLLSVFPLMTGVNPLCPYLRWIWLLHVLLWALISSAFPLLPAWSSGQARLWFSFPSIPGVFAVSVQH